MLMKPGPEKTAVDAAAAAGVDVAAMVAAETAVVAVAADAAVVMAVAVEAAVAVAMIAPLAGNQQVLRPLWSAAFFSCTPNKFNWTSFRKDAFVLW